MDDKSNTTENKTTDDPGSPEQKVKEGGQSSASKLEEVAEKVQHTEERELAKTVDSKSENDASSASEKLIRSLTQPLASHEKGSIAAGSYNVVAEQGTVDATSTSKQEPQPVLTESKEPLKADETDKQGIASHVSTSVPPFTDATAVTSSISQGQAPVAAQLNPPTSIKETPSHIVKVPYLPQTKSGMRMSVSAILSESGREAQYRAETTSPSIKSIPSLHQSSTTPKTMAGTSSIKTLDQNNGISSTRKKDTGLNDTQLTTKIHTQPSNQNQPTGPQEEALVNASLSGRSGSHAAEDNEKTIKEVHDAPALPEKSTEESTTVSSSSTTSKSTLTNEQLVRALTAVSPISVPGESSIANTINPSTHTSTTPFQSREPHATAPSTESMATNQVIGNALAAVAASVNAARGNTTLNNGAAAAAFGNLAAITSILQASTGSNTLHKGGIDEKTASQHNNPLLGANSALSKMINQAFRMNARNQTGSNKGSSVPSTSHKPNAPSNSNGPGNATEDATPPAAGLVTATSTSTASNNTIETKKPRLIVRNEKVLEAARAYKEKHLGIFVYEPGKLLPRFDQNLNGILDVLIPAKYLTYDNPQVKKKAIWGTDIYTDDSDVVSMILHSGKYTAEFIEPEIDPHNAFVSALAAEIKFDDEDQPKRKHATIPDHDLKVTLRVLPTLQRYKGYIRNYIASRSWGGNHDGVSFYVEKVERIQLGDARPPGRRILKEDIAKYAYERNITLGLTSRKRTYHDAAGDDDSQESKPPAKSRKAKSRSEREIPKLHADFALSSSSSCLFLALSNDSKLEQTTVQEQAYQSDPRFRKYVQLIEKNLNSFDAVNEWADIISFLGRLLKSFQAYPQFPVVPRKHTVAKRLAQCLNPGFPAGVHQKTLDVYAYILDTIGPDQLAEDLALWSLGLFPFVQYAAMHVKPQLLSIFEKYFFPLERRLRPAMRGFIIALLPALEEEGSEFFDKVVVLLDHLANAIDFPFFYSCIWRTMITNPSLRSPALNYLLRRLPKISDQEDVITVIGTPETVSLMVRAFAATLGDQQLLVQRAMLELLVQNFALRHRTIPHDDLVILMKGALSIVLRKDMSLNRRLYAWLLGDEGTSQTQQTYFNTYAEKAATQAVRGMLFATTESGHQYYPEREIFVIEAQKPYKILISLLDKWEIGQTIVQNIFTGSLTSLQAHMQRGHNAGEILQTANMWMEMMEPYLIWMKLFSLLDASFPGKSGVQGSNMKGYSSSDMDNLNTIIFSLKSFKFTDEEIKHMHLPFVVVALAQKLRDSTRHPAFIDILPLAEKCLELLHCLLQMVPENMYWDRGSSRTQKAESDKTRDHKMKFESGMDALEYVREFYGIKNPHQKHGTSTLGNGLQKFTNGNSRPVADTRDAAAEIDIEDEGDLSVSHSASGLVTGQAVSIRAEYGPIRGSALVRELSNHLAQFLIDLVNNYIVPPDGFNAGIDVGEEGKRLRTIDSQLEKILHGVCSALVFVAKRADEHFVWTGEARDNLARTLLMCCHQGHQFGVVDAGLSTLSQLIKRKRFLDGTVLKHRKILKAIMDKLWGFLCPAVPLLHIRTVQLVWLLTESSLPHQIETIISSYLTVEDDTERYANYEKFGILWEFSEDIPEATTVFTRPMFLILDLIREGASPLDRRIGETWIRCHLKSYVRLLEPFVLTLLDSRILWQPADKKVPYEHQSLLHGEQKEHVLIPYYVYIRPIDTATIDYMFTNLIALVNLGSSGFLRACKSHYVSNSDSLKSLIEASLGLSISDGGRFTGLTFLELLVHISVRYLASEPNQKLRQRMLKDVRIIQLHAAEFLYQIISKVDYVDIKLVRLIQENTLLKLLFCISEGELELQQKLLHVVHAAMAIVAAVSSNHKSPSGSASERQYRRKGSLDSATSDNLAQYAMDAMPRSTLPTSLGMNAAQASEAVQLAKSTSALFVKCVMDALMVPSNRRIIQHWMDFLLASLSHLRGGFRQIIVPILMSICEQITLCQTAVKLIIHGESDAASSFLSTPLHRPQITREAATTADHNHHGPYLRDQGAVLGGPEHDILIFLNGLERILMFCITDHSLSDEWYTEKAEQYPLPIPQVVESSSLKGLVQVMQGEDVPHLTDMKPRDVTLYYLPIMLHILLDVWRVFRRPEWDGEISDAIGYAKRDAILQSFASAADHVKARLEHIFERLHKYCTFDFIEGFTEIFFMENPIALEYEASREQYDLVVLDVLSATPSSSPQHILSTLLDSIRQRTSGMHVHRRRHILRAGKLTDTSILRFAEIYCSNLIKMDPLAHLWPLIHSFAKDYLSQASAYKTILPGLLRFLTVALDGLTRSTAGDDRKVRRDAQDLYQRCVDYCILIAGRSFDQSLWLRRSNVHDEEDSVSTPTDALSLSDTLISDSARNMSSSNVSDLEKKASWKAREDMMIAQVNSYLATTVIPNLRQLVGDQDRINSLLNNLVYYVIGPALKTKVAFSKIALILDQICEMAQMPFTYKTWRKEVWEVFLDNRFFYMSAAMAKKWRIIIQTVFSLEKERFIELVGRITTSPSTAFFSNKDQETVNRALSLRRLSYVIFCGDVDQYVPQLPIIQEKLVELLKLEHGEMVHVEIYLCLRILLVRFSSKHLLNFWPVLITELMRLFSSFINSTSNDRPEEAQIALAGCKFLDLLCTLETDAFQIYQWIFIRDTVETQIQRTNDDECIPMMNLWGKQLADSHDDPTAPPHNVSIDTTDALSAVPSLGQLKRPMLTMRSISSIRQLSFFIDNVGLYVYQTSFTLAKPDMPFIESLLQNDLLEGDIESE